MAKRDTKNINMAEGLFSSATSERTEPKIGPHKQERVEGGAAIQANKKRVGRPRSRPNENGKLTSFFATDDQIKQIKVYAAVNDMDNGSVIRKALDCFFEKKKEQ